jgi:sugar phosphate isomerase/epimerase
VSGAAGSARVGLMLYTVRRDCARDFGGTLRAVAALGYEGVELFDLHGHEASSVRAWLDDAGLVACGAHASLGAVEERLPELAAALDALGARRLVVSSIEPPASAADTEAALERLGGAGRRAAELGVELGFHNHHGELRPLEGARTFLDELIERAPELFLELDLGWAWYAGADPVELLARARGRCPLVHVKDFRGRGKRAFAPVGEGAVGYERVAPAAVRAGVEWLLVEQDETDGPALDAARDSLASLRAMLEVRPSS